ncbi:MAG: VanZ family protein [Longimicrobiales bacterium]
MALGWAALILALTLFPGPEITAPPEDLPSTLCLICGGRGGADAILNVLLFLPLGVALMAATDKPFRMIALVASMSVGIEVLQGMIPGRYPTLGDVVYNVVGGGAGVGLAAVRGQLLWPSRRIGGALTIGTGAAAAAVFFLTGLLLTPSVPDTVYYGQWTPDLHYMEAYGGRVLEASLGSMFLGSKRTSDPALAVSLVRSGGPLDARVVAGPAPPALAPIISIFDESSVEIVVLGADVTDLVLRVRYRANDFRLDRPDLRVRGAFSDTRPGDTIRLSAEKALEGYSLRLEQREYAPLRHTLGEGWALLFHPEHTAPWVDFTLNLAWVAGPLILAGWWAPGIGWAAAALSLAVSGMAMGAAVGPLTDLTTAEILVAFLGVLIGMALRRAHLKGSTMPPLCASVAQGKPRTGSVLMTGANGGTTK